MAAVAWELGGHRSIGGEQLFSFASLIILTCHFFFRQLNFVTTHGFSCLLVLPPIPLWGHE